jgi:hypothetical protein
MSINQRVTPKEIAKIRKLEDFDLIMLISEIHDHGWPMARATLCLMPPDPDEAAYKKRQQQWLHLRAALKP